MGQVRLDDTREVVEVLICSGQPYGQIIGLQSASKSVLAAAYAAWFEVSTGHGYNADCLEAAYRIIESSPTLRREWFGTPNRKKS